MVAIPFLFAHDWFKVAREPDLAKEMSKKICLGDSGKGFRSATSFLLRKSSSDDTTLELLQPSSSLRGVREGRPQSYQRRAPVIVELLNQPSTSDVLLCKKIDSSKKDSVMGILWLAAKSS